MFTVGFDKELREAFAAGQASMMPLLMKTRRPKDTSADKFMKAVPQTYEAWIESIRDRPQVRIG